MKKKTFSLLLAFIFIISSVGCAGNATAVKEEPSTIATQEEPKQTKEEPSVSPEEPVGDTYTFTDSCGREVELPNDIQKIAPSGPLAQIVLYTLCPDKMVGWASEFSELQQEYIDEKYSDLPVFGNFYGDTLNLESVMVAQPDVVFDIGEAKNTIVEDMDGIQEKTGIPAVFVEMELDSMVSAYEILGKLTGEEEQAEKIITYIEDTFKDVESKAAAIPEAERLSVYYGQDNGFTALVKGTVHADVIDFVGGINVAEAEETLRGGASEISMEQLLLWNPDVILFVPNSMYDTVDSEPEWQEVTAIKENKYYEVPDGPYNWMGRPPSVNRVLGIKWLANLLYPDIFDYDMVAETKEFYELFYHSAITDEQAKELLIKSTFK